jgi:hypothetical protein
VVKSNLTLTILFLYFLYQLVNKYLNMFLILSTILGFSQSALQPVKLDNLVTASFPVGYQTKDTAGQHIISGNGTYGYMIGIRAANDKDNTPLKKEKDLNKVLKDYTKKIQAQEPGSSPIRARDTTIGTLKGRVFTLKSEDGLGNVQFVNFTLIYTKDATYTFEYVYPGNRSELVAADYKSFISSIRLSPELQRNDQYLSNVTGMSVINKVEIFGGVALVIVVALIFISNKKRKLQVS